jgi:hypothetical protein
MLGWDSEESTRIRQANSLMDRVSATIEDDAFLNGAGLERTFKTEQSVVNLHAWLINQMLIAERDRAGLAADRPTQMQQELFDVLWKDTAQRVRETPGIMEITVNKNLRLVQEMSFAHMMEYDHGFKQKDDDNLELGAALWRNLFDGDEGVEDGNVERVAVYMRREAAKLEALSAKDSDAALWGEFDWGRLE